MKPNGEQTKQKENEGKHNEPTEEIYSKTMGEDKNVLNPKMGLYLCFNYFQPNFKIYQKVRRKSSELAISSSSTAFPHKGMPTPRIFFSIAGF